MPRLIDANKVMKLIHTEEYNARMAIAYAQTVDAVEVIRCRNCKYYKAVTDSIGTCTMVNMNSTPEGYCAWGERKENE